MNYYYTTKQLAVQFPAVFSESSLKKSRMNNSAVDGPPWKKKGAKVFYDRDEVVAWIGALPERGASNLIPMPKPLVRPPGKRGRPTKAEEIARRTRAA